MSSAARTQPAPHRAGTGCPERPNFTALELEKRERGAIRISPDIGCNTSSTLPAFNMGSTVLGYPSQVKAARVRDLRKKPT